MLEVCALLSEGKFFVWGEMERITSSAENCEGKV